MHTINLSSLLTGLSTSQLVWISEIVTSFRQVAKFNAHPKSDLVNDLVLEHLGNLLRLHHATSHQNLQKAPFEYALERALNMSNIVAKRAESATNPGADMLIREERFSLKTEGAKGIKKDFIHVSKWCEAGAGIWAPETIQRAAFLEHLTRYDRIITLRCLAKAGGSYWYELVEIPKSLMLDAATGKMVKAPKTKQDTFPWSCWIPDQDAPKAEVYFDAGSERKIQVRKIRKDACFVHATWRFGASQIAGLDEDEESEAVAEPSNVANPELF